MDPYQTYAKLLNNIVKVNKQRVEDMRKLAELQDLHVVKYSRSRLEEDNIIYLVILDDSYYTSFYNNGNIRSIFRTSSNPKLNGTKYSYKTVRCFCAKACKAAVRQLSIDHNCRKRMKRQYRKDCKYYSNLNIKD